MVAKWAACLGGVIVQLLKAHVFGHDTIKREAREKWMPPQQDTQLRHFIVA